MVTGCTSGAATDTAARRSELAALQERLAEPLVVEARRLGLGLAELIDIVRARWKRLDKSR